MTSPARRHFLKASATASAVASATPETNDRYQLMQAALIEGVVAFNRRNRWQTATAG